MSKKSAIERVSFHYQANNFSFRGRNTVKAGVVELFKLEGIKLSRLEYVFCNDSYLLEINREFLKHDFYTDIITFQTNAKKEAAQGEVYISVERVKENARIFKTPFSTELRRVIYHGALHLCGYKDKTKAEVARMREREDKYLALF